MTPKSFQMQLTAFLFNDIRTATGRRNAGSVAASDRIFLSDQDICFREVDERVDLARS